MQASKIIPLEVHQGILEKQLHQIFHNEEIQVNVKKPSNLQSHSSNLYLELDVWLPKLNLAFEFQDQHHYTTTWYVHKPTESVRHNDSFKKRAALLRGLSVIVVPCWWDGTYESLSATIHFERPELLRNPMISPISLNPFFGYFPFSRLPEVDELMVASFPTDYKFESSVVPNDWWMGEKYDGVRCFWHPLHQSVYTRSGNLIQMHDRCKEFFPSIYIDGEFWFGRGCFYNTYALHNGSDNIFWDALRAIAFDVPSHDLQNYPFEQRYRHLLANIDLENPFLFIAPRVLCQDSRHLNEINFALRVNGGEGVIMRKVHSLYERGRTSSLVKLKASSADREGLVVNVLESGAVELKLPEGQIFTIPAENVHIPTPKSGEIVTFSYELSTRTAIPTSAEVFRTRTDISWEDVVSNYAQERKFITESETATEISTTPSEKFSPPNEKLSSPQRHVGYWNPGTIRSFLIEFAQQMNLDPLLPETWYSIPYSTVYRTRGGMAIQRIFGALHTALRALFPEITFDQTRFYQPKNWVEISNRRGFFEKYAKENDFDPLIAQNWYDQEKDKILYSKGGLTVMGYYNGSIANALSDLFPDIGIDRSKMRPQSAWLDEKSRRKFFEDFAMESGFDPLIAENWAVQPRHKLMKRPGVHGVLDFHNESLNQALVDLFPEIRANKSQFKLKKLKAPEIHQGVLEKQLQVIFPNEERLVEVKKHSNLKHPTTEFYMELDVLLPRLNLAFEFQDAYHYVTTWYAPRTISTVQASDSAKKIAALSRGISVVVVPCWWDGATESLRTTINFERPELIKRTKSRAISLNPPLGHFPMAKLPHIGELMLASFPTDSKFQSSIVPQNWWMGEKYDGVRCFWNPTQRTAYTRTANIIPLHECVTDCFPAMYTDGEFWFGRGSFAFTYVLYKGAIEKVQWDLLRSITFDVPSLDLQNYPFEARYHHLLANVEIESPFVIVAPRVLCVNSKHTSFFIAGIISDAGEGAILREVSSRYERGRTSSLVKLKASLADREGLVVDVLENGAVKLKLPGGQIFTVAPEKVSISLPKKGEIVTFSYEISSRRDLPMNPEIYRIRNDLSWEYVVHSFSQERKIVTENSQDTENFTSHPQGYWTFDTMRAYMIDFARQWKLDPLISDTWYTIPLTALHNTKGGRAILRKYKGMHLALSALFPETSFDPVRFQQSVWNDIANRRQFFEKYAKANGFDPLLPENWYYQSRRKIMESKGGYAVMGYHNNSVARALVEIFPDIGIERKKMWPKSAWLDAKYRRKFFEIYAKENGFDPLLAENWYLQSKRKILANKGTYAILSHHKESLTRALVDLFPEIGLDKSQLWLKSNVEREPKKNEELAHKQFFVNFAKERGFDPLSPQNWYTQSRKEIMASSKDANAVMGHFNGSVSRALIHLFPNIGLERGKMWASPDWTEVETRRKFFEDFAKENGFNPLNPKNWYNQAREKIMERKNCFSVLYYHKGSVTQALLDLFPNIGLSSEKLVASSTDIVAWHQQKNRRKFFEDYAKKHRFDVLNPENWHTHKSQLAATKGIQQVIAHHGNSISKALKELFPNIGLDTSQFWSKKISWSDHRARRRFFEKYARENGFDPLKAFSWYAHKEDLYKIKGTTGILRYHDNSVAKALVDLFPEIKFDKSKLVIKTKYPDDKARRKFFENYAKENNFDSLFPENWYSQTKQQIISTKNGLLVVKFYKGELPEALADVFPNIGIDKTKFNPRRKRANVM